MTSAPPYRSHRWLVAALLALMAIGAAVGALQAQAASARQHAASPLPRSFPPELRRLVREANAGRVFGTLDDGTVATFAAGERFAVILSSWAEWRVEAVPPGVRLVSSGAVAPSGGATPGSDVWQVTIFEAVEPSHGDLALALGRPWMENDRLDSFRLTVRIHGAPHAPPR
jgi:hypothetical protein